MRVAALISGGKDSCFNMMTCIAEGHDIVALANLRPQNKDELDSYMYQTVGHHAIDLYAEAMGLPLYVNFIKGSSLCIKSDYLPQEGDEVEDLYQLLSQIKAEKDIEAVSVGAIMSDYQRVRVENVCQRLNLKALAFLWRRNQEELLREMIDCDLKAIIIKVAAMGLLPHKHLGMELKEILPHMLKMKEKYGLNECGEGGEYETFVFDCPLFKKSIVIEDKELVIHSDDPFAPVGYLNLKNCRLQEKPNYNIPPFLETIDKLPLLTTSKWIAKHLDQCKNDDVSQCLGSENKSPEITSLGEESDFLPSFKTDGVDFQVSGITATLKKTSDISCSTEMAMDCLKECVEKLGHQMSHLTSVSLYVQNMSNYALINAVYVKYFNINPPVRICVQVCLPPNVLFQIDCQGHKEQENENARKTMHVQSLSHWAPANIGPFSQAILTGRKLIVSGTVALIPSTLALIDGGITLQSKVALDHVKEKLLALWSSCTLAHCPLVNCYVTNKDYIPAARGVLKSLMQAAKETLLSVHNFTFGIVGLEIFYGQQESKLVMEDSVGLSPAVQYCVVPRLPKSASVEWQVSAWVLNNSDEDVNCNHYRETFSSYTITVDCTQCQELFSCKIEVYSTGTDKIDVKELARDLLKSYSHVWKLPGVNSLANIFFPAKRFSYQDVIESFTQDVPSIDMNKLPTFSFIPVVCLESERHLFAWCQ